MAKKLFAVLFAVVLTLSLAACSKDAKKTVSVKDETVGAVASNGGFLVETGDYVYFLNGVASAGKYEVGSVTKGALVRVKKTELAAGSANAVDVVVSRLVVSDDKNSGVYLFDGYFYYAAVSTGKNSDGEVKTDKLVFLRTKADGSDTSKSICDKDYGSSVEFRFVSAGKNVYLIVKDSSSVYVYDAVARKELFKYNDSVSSVQEFMFSSDAGDPTAFFSIKPVNKTTYPVDDDPNRTAEKYHEVYALRFGADKAEVKKELVLNGIGKNTVGNTEEKGVYLTGATFDLVRYVGGELYYSVTSLDSTGSVTLYNRVAKADLTESNSLGYNGSAVHETMNYGDKVAASAFSDTSLIVSAREILYVNSTQGLMRYDYKEEKTANVPDGALKILDNEKIKGATLDFIVNENGTDYLYYHNGNVYYKVNYTAIKDGTNMDEEPLRLNTYDVKTDWYKPEVVAFEKDGAKHYAFIGVYSDESFMSYVYAIDTTKLKADYDAFCQGKETDEEKAKFYDAPTETKKKYEFINSTLLGKMTDANAKTVKDELAKKKS